jgi:HEAT repeat protein
MVPKPRFSVRSAMIWIGAIASLLALGRYPYIYFQAQRRFSARAQEGAALVQSYYVQCPSGASTRIWREAVTGVQIAWCNVVFAPSHFPDEDALDWTLAQMRGLVARATPAKAEGDLYLILDLLAHARTLAGPAYLSNRRAELKKGLQGYGRPSPVLVDYALRWVGPRSTRPTVATITEGLHATDWRLRVACCRALGQYGLGLGSQDEADEALTALIGALDNDDPLVREIAIETFHEIGPEAARVKDALVQKLHLDPTARVRWQAARTLTRVAKEGKSVVPALITAIRDDDLDVRIMAISSLGQLREAALEAVPALSQALGDDEDRVRQAAVAALVNVGPSSGAVVPPLLNVLKRDPEWRVRDATAAALGQLGPAAAAAVPALIEASLRDDEPNVRRECALALARVGVTETTVLTSLTQSLRHDKSWFVREAAAKALGEIGPFAASAVTALVEARIDPIEMVRTAVTESLGKIGADSRRSVNVLTGLLADEYPRTREAALRSLGRFGTEARAAVPLIIAIRDAPAGVQADYVVAAATAALEKIESRP